MANNRFQKKSHYNLIDQQISLKRNYPGSECYIRHGVLTWRGFICPTALSRTYQVTITYKIGFRPQVTVSGDNLVGLDRPNFPHKFQVDQENSSVTICLHLGHEFDSTELISDCIIPWTTEWLYFYEIWLATGEWCGGGKHPGQVPE